jgi:ubiquinone/menaquinone biosynthesis C-methylase UbiE
VTDPLTDDSSLPRELREATFTKSGIYDAADWYDVEYAAYRGEESFYRLMLQRYVKPGGVVVELGVGTGRLALRFAAEGFAIHGVEPSQEMRDRLAKKAAQAHVTVALEDAIASTFVGSSQRSDVVTFPFNGLMHIDTRDEMLASFRHVKEKLDDGGRFCLDITGPYWEAMLLGATAWGKSDERTHPESGRKVLTCDRSTYDAKTKLMHIHIRYLIAGDERGAEVELVQRMWTWQEVQGGLDECGFVVEHVFGDVDMAPFDEGSPRLLLCARKR